MNKKTRNIIISSTVLAAIGTGVFIWVKRGTFKNEKHLTKNNELSDDEAMALWLRLNRMNGDEFEAFAKEATYEQKKVIKQYLDKNKNKFGIIKTNKIYFGLKKKK